MFIFQNRIWQRDYRDRRALQPESIYVSEMLPPPSYMDNPINAVTTRFVKTATNKMRCPIFTLAWTPEGRRLVTGASSGEFTLWNGLTFNFETILQVCRSKDSIQKQIFWLIQAFYIQFRRMMYQFEQWFGHTMTIGWLLVTMQAMSNTGNRI